MHESLVREYINESITGNPHEWPLEWFRSEFVKTPFSEALSLGCGEGSLERDVLKKSICNKINGIDISNEILTLADVRQLNFTSCS